MASYVVLDSEAVSVLAFPRERGVSARRAHAILIEAERRNALVRIPAAVLAEVYRGSPPAVNINRESLRRDSGVHGQIACEEELEPENRDIGFHTNIP